MRLALAMTLALTLTGCGAPMQWSDPTTSPGDYLCGAYDCEPVTYQYKPPPPTSEPARGACGGSSYGTIASTSSGNSMADRIRKGSSPTLGRIRY